MITSDKNEILIDFYFNPIYMQLNAQRPNPLKLHRNPPELDSTNTPTRKSVFTNFIKETS